MAFILWKSSIGPGGQGAPTSRWVQAASGQHSQQGPPASTAPGLPGSAWGLHVHQQHMHYSASLGGWDPSLQLLTTVSSPGRKMPQVHCVNDFPVLRGAHASPPPMTATHLLSGSSCPHLKGGRGISWMTGSIWDMCETLWCDCSFRDLSTSFKTADTCFKHPSFRYAGNEQCIVWMCIYLACWWRKDPIFSVVENRSYSCCFLSVLGQTKLQTSENCHSASSSYLQSTFLMIWLIKASTKTIWNNHKITKNSESARIYGNHSPSKNIFFMNSEV